MGLFVRIHALATNTIREAIRNKLLYTLLGFAIVMIGAGVVIATLSYVEVDEILQDIGMGAIRFFSAGIAIFVGIGLIHDEVDTHLALRGQGFFTAGEAGNEVLVRSGNFQLDADGYLVTSGGLKVQGQSGAIQLQQGESLTVAQDGTIVDDQGAALDKLRIVNAAELEPLGGTSWRPTSAAYEVEGVSIVQGALEGSNTDPMRSMTELMEASRYFEAYQKAMQTSDQLDGQLNQMVSS